MKKIQNNYCIFEKNELLYCCVISIFCEDVYINADLLRFICLLLLVWEVTEMKYYENPVMSIESLEVEKAVAISLDLEAEGPEVELSAGTMLGL